MKYLIYFFLIIFIHACANSPKNNIDLQTESIESNQPIKACQEGEIKQGFLTPTAAGNFACTHGLQTCISGQWVGPFLYENCDNLPASCDGQPHGSIQSGYLQPFVNGGFSCIPATRTCANGVWIGPEVYSSCTQAP